MSLFFSSLIRGEDDIYAIYQSTQNVVGPVWKSTRQINIQDNEKRLELSRVGVL